MTITPSPRGLYVAGPMRGHDLWNFPAFREATTYLRHQGYRVVSPHELDEAIGFTEDTVELPDGFVHEAMRRDIEALLTVEGIILLPGWEASTGARFELTVAEQLGLEVWCYYPSRQWGCRIASASYRYVARRIAEHDDPSSREGVKVIAGPDPWPAISTDLEPDGDANPKDLIGSTKPDVALVPPVAILHEAQAMANGAAKYGAYNWRLKRVLALVYLSACFRHLYAWLDGEELAADSGVHHLGHARACLGILLDAIETGNLIDNRPTAGAAAEVVDRMTVTA